MAKKKSLFQEFTKGILVENPVLRLVLGTCPTLAVSTSVESALGMGVAASIVLVCSNIAISALKKVIPQKVRIPAYIVIIASFVTIVQMLVKAFVPQIDAQLGVYLPLIVVNCIILGRAEMYANKHGVVDSAIDGLGMKAQNASFLDQFKGKVKDIAVNKNSASGNEIQALTGATITSKAVTAAVNGALSYYDSNLKGAE